MNTKINKSDIIIARLTKYTMIVLVMVLSIWGIYELVATLRYTQTNDAQVDAYVNPINTRVSGFIKKINFEENQLVKKGDTLVIIDSTEYSYQQDQSMGDLRIAEAELNELSSTLETAGFQSLSSRSAIDAAQAKLDKAEKDYRRFVNLLAQQAATQQQFDEVKASLEVARSEYSSVINDYKTSLSKTKDIQVKKSRLAAEIEKRKVMLKYQQLSTSYTIIRAPYDGYVGKRNIEEGQVVQAGQTLTFIVGGNTGKWVVANFMETDMEALKVGQEAKITIDAFPDKIFHGKVTSFSPLTGSRYSLLPSDNATGNFVKIIQRIPVKIQFTDLGEKIGRLQPGMNAVVKIIK